MKKTVKALTTVIALAAIWPLQSMAEQTTVSANVQVKHLSMSFSNHKAIEWGAINPLTYDVHCEMDYTGAISGSVCFIEGATSPGAFDISGTPNASIQISANSSSANGAVFTPKFSNGLETEEAIYTTTLDNLGDSSIVMVGKIKLINADVVAGQHTALITTIDITYN